MAAVPPVILIADDFAMTCGISEGILALAAAGRLSGTSAMVNLPHWPSQAAAAVALRERFALGLHLNLTFGPPLGAMPRLAPAGEFPEPNRVVARAMSRALDRDEIAGEIERQIDRFEQIAGVPPDYIDGHHHVHVLPIVRGALASVMARRFPKGGPLVRDPADRPSAIIHRKLHATKAMGAGTLAAGFRKLMEANGFPTNIGFSGYSTFGPLPYANEFASFLIDLGARPMIMCHPGLPDDELGRRDLIAARRPEEHAYLAARPGLRDLIWHVNGRDSAGFPWQSAA